MGGGKNLSVPNTDVCPIHVISKEVTNVYKLCIHVSKGVVAQLMGRAFSHMPFFFVC